MIFLIGNNFSMRMLKRSQQCGFSMVELMVTMSVLLLLVLVAIPSFQQTMMGIRSGTLVDSLVSAINYTRSEAIKRNEDVSLCASTNATTCNNNSWNTGWIVLIPSSGNVLRYWQQTNGNEQVSLAGAAGLSLIYNAEGEARLSDNSPGAVFSTEISGCNVAPLNLRDHRRVITLSAVGIVRVARAQC